MSIIKKEILIEGMSCEHCVRAAKNALEDVEGVSGADVSLEEKRAVISVSPDVADDALVEALKQEEFEVKEIKIYN